jgi:aspyridone synthetase (hybrid polyketide synthase/nonribosomal peptide synthetase)
MAEPLAIVGSSCRFPGGASSPSRLWQLLKAPYDLLRPPTEQDAGDSWNRDGDPRYRAYNLEEDCRRFDAAFFKISPKEAAAMDPQQRLVLETVFEAVEDAGWTLDRIKGSMTSVHVGVMSSDYSDIQMRDPDGLPTYAATGTSRSILANRISYFFDFRGPSITLDTACSSSLVALHQAIQGIRNGDADQAVIAGSALCLDPAMFNAETNLGMLSPDFRSRMWDVSANGYARGEGCAVILIKSLSKALNDGDDVECLIRGIGVNSDGRTSGLTIPSASAQTTLIRETYKKAGLDILKDRCQFFECHGTGTPVGDPIEALAIKEAFFPAPPEHHCGSLLYCGSIKTVIGHLEGCAGLAGILKASLAIQNKAIIPNLHFTRFNPVIEPYSQNLCVPTSLHQWPTSEGKVRRASVNSFGFGGTNAHVILEEYLPTTVSPKPINKDVEDGHIVPDTVPLPFVFSANSESSLHAYMGKLSAYLLESPSIDIKTLSWMLHSRRTVFPVRTSITASDSQALINSLNKMITSNEDQFRNVLSITRANPDTKGHAGILAVFTGQVCLLTKTTA